MISDVRKKEVKNKEKIKKGLVGEGSKGQYKMARKVKGNRVR